jgi:hypothetical protein
LPLPVLLLAVMLPVLLAVPEPVLRPGPLRA